MRFNVFQPHGQQRFRWSVSDRKPYETQCPLIEPTIPRAAETPVYSRVKANTPAGNPPKPSRERVSHEKSIYHTAIETTERWVLKTPGTLFFHRV